MEKYRKRQSHDFCAERQKFCLNGNFIKCINYEINLVELVCVYLFVYSINSMWSSWRNGARPKSIILRLVFETNGLFLTVICYCSCPSRCMFIFHGIVICRKNKLKKCHNYWDIWIDGHGLEYKLYHWTVYWFFVEFLTRFLYLANQQCLCAQWKTVKSIKNEGQK